ncbi:MAG: DUF421 domain-containing protein [Firmicutes bacterium]|nr:DUF421 domain-containing protein [Bacillota bacterium]
MALIFIRTILLYFITLFAMKAMGKRQLGQLQPFEVVIVLIVSDMATLAMQSNTISLLSSLIPILIITLVQIILSLLTMKSEKLRVLICGRPVILIENGMLNEKNMGKLRIHLNDLQEMCRSQGYFDISSIHTAVMETNGTFSVLPRSEKRPLQVGDMLPDPPPERSPQLVILDGIINDHGLKSLGRDRNWLEKQLKLARISNAEELFVAGCDESGDFFWQKKEGGAHS